MNDIIFYFFNVVLLVVAFYIYVRLKPDPKNCVHLWDIYSNNHEIRCMKCKTLRPYCYNSNPSPQSQAENCCEDCPLQKDCY